MGKSETAKLFARLGICVFDSDAAVHALYAQGGMAVAPIAEAFPDAVQNGAVDRARLTHVVKRDETAFQRLESVVHPLVKDSRRRFIAAAQARGEPIVVLDIPLLFETMAQGEVDAIVVVSAPEQVQRERVLKRAGMTLEKLEAIHARQIPDAEKRAKADFVIETASGLEHANRQVQQVVAELRRRIAHRGKQ
jgi:dephospho-CoA kinase